MKTIFIYLFIALCANTMSTSLAYADNNNNQTTVESTQVDENGSPIIQIESSKPFDKDTGES